MSELRKYGVLLTTAKAIQFTLYQIDGIDIEPVATFAIGDIKISKDGGAEVNTTNLPVDEGQGYRLILTAAELTASRIRLFIVDQTATKVWLDIEINIETHGHASAMYVTDFDEVMRGTDNAATEAKQDIIDTNVDTLLTRIIGTLAAGTHNPATAAQIAVLSDWINGGRLDLILDIIAADTTTDIPALIAAAQADLDIITGVDGATLASTQGATTWEEITLSPIGNAPNIDFNGAGTGDVFTFTRTGSGNLYDAAYAADLLAAIVSGGAVLSGANINQIMLDLANGGRTDLLIDAIKVKTDQMVFTKANELDSNTKSINNAEVVGDGNVTPWDGI